MRFSAGWPTTSVTSAIAAVIADVAVLYPQRTIAFYRSGAGPGAWSGADRARTSEYLQGIHYALLEGRILSDFVAEDDLAEEIAAEVSRADPAKRRVPE